MSRTDKARPFWVKVKDQRGWLVAEHDHRLGGCDLPADPVWHGAPSAPQTRCEWSLSADAWAAPLLQCGCRMCTGQVGRKAGRRRERAEARQYVAGGWKQEYA